MASQVVNGKAFEYAIANEYYKYLQARGIQASLLKDAAFKVAESFYLQKDDASQRSFDNAAQQTIETLMVLEPGLSTERSSEDLLKIYIAPDVNGEMGDVRDVIFKRSNSKPAWEIGFSAKNNHEAVKHSRLSMSIDFGEKWVGHKCTSEYFQEISQIFQKLETLLEIDSHMTWDQLDDKDINIYMPILKAFRKEMLKLASQHKDLPKKLLEYLIGQYPFYKIIKDDNSKTVVVKAFNINGRLNATVNGKKALVKTDKIKMPSRIIEFEFVPGSTTTLMMVLDHGWQISFRIHSAKKVIEKSLKFDIQLIGNPPILFTQHLFNIQ